VQNKRVLDDLPVTTFSNDPDSRAQRGKQSEKLQFRLGKNLCKGMQDSKTWLQPCRVYTEVFVNHDYLGFNYPDHKSLGIRRQCSEPIINLWWEIPPYNGLFP
jgi:hypothetical protein